MLPIFIRGYIFTFAASDFCDETLAKLTGAAWCLKLLLLPGDRAGAMRFCGVAPSTLRGLDRGTIRAGDSRKADIYRAWLWLASF
jgi:hypothetical protein